MPPSDDAIQLPAKPALLITDIVGSTELNETLGDDRMAELWSAHDRVARDLLVTHHGQEIDRADGCLLCFAVAADAMTFVRDYHEGLHRIGLAARAGLHVGPVTVRENPAAEVARGAKRFEVLGLAKSIAARVMSLAPEVRTLMSAAARDALGVTPHPVRAHGHWKLKGVAEPQELFEIGSVEAASSPPIDTEKGYRVARHGDLWLPVRQIPHHLPAQRYAFVGRRDDLDQLARRIDDGA